MRLDRVRVGERWRVTGCPELRGVLVKVLQGCCIVKLGSGERLMVHIPEAGNRPERDFLAEVGNRTEFSRGTPVTLEPMGA